MIEINKIYCGDCLDIMKKLPNECIDMILTSPPYDNLRNYENYTFNFEDTAKELFRLTKMGGVIVWVVGDQVINGSETGTSFKQALYFKELGFNLHDTMIYMKDGSPFPEQTRYLPCFEYMFVLSKGKPKSINLLKEKTKGYKPSTSNTKRQKDGTLKLFNYERGKELRSLYNVWLIQNGYMKTTKDIFAYEHPAMFPEELAIKHIQSWSNECDLILDPFNGSGTTTKSAKYLKRNFIGIDISEKYCEIARQRLRQEILL